MPFLARILTTLALGSLMTTTGVYAGDGPPTITVGTQEIGLSAGYLVPHLLKGKKSKTEQSGPAFMPSWMMTLTDPIGGSWYRGQISLGAEMVYIQFQEPVLTHGVGFTPKSNTASSHLTESGPMPNLPEAPFGPISAGRFRNSLASLTSF